MCSMICNQQALTALIFVEGTVTTVVHAVTEKWGSSGYSRSRACGNNISAGWWMRPHTTNVTMDILHDVSGSSGLSNRFPEHFWCGGLDCHIHLTWIPVAVSFGDVSKIVCTITTAQCSTGASRLWWCCCCWKDYRWHVTWYRWQLCGSFKVSPQSQRIS